MINRANVGEVTFQTETDLASVIHGAQWFDPDVIISLILELADLIPDNNSMRELITGIQEMIDD